MVVALGSWSWRVESVDVFVAGSRFDLGVALYIHSFWLSEFCSCACSGTV